MRDSGLCLFVSLILLASTSTVHANGRFPAAGQLVVDPGDGAHIVVRTTYGLLTTRDAGLNWDWICETAVGYSATTPVDPAMGVTQDGSLLAAFGGGLSVTHDLSCVWTFAGGGLEGQNVVDVSTERANPSHAIAIISTAGGSGQFKTQLYESLDNAVSWAQSGIDLPVDFEAETLDAAPSDSQRIYVSGLSAGVTGTLMRTADRGLTWDSFDIAWPDGGGGTGMSDVNHLPFIAGVDPLDEEVVYVRLSGTPGRLLVTTDGGATWALAFEGQGSLKGFALSPDGSQLLVGGDGDGTWRAPTSTLIFEQISGVRPQCLTWVEAGIYACALEYIDGFTVGLSTDDGASWQTINSLACVRGPLSCPDGSSVKDECEDTWAATAELINQESCFSDGGDEDTATPSPATSPSPTASGGEQSTDGDEAEAGCGCHSSQTRGGGQNGDTLLLCVGLVAISVRRRADTREAPGGTPGVAKRMGWVEMSV